MIRSRAIQARTIKPDATCSKVSTDKMTTMCDLQNAVCCAMSAWTSRGRRLQTQHEPKVSAGAAAVEEAAHVIRALMP